ncbi:Uncharacterized protein FWK35_00020745 [Aphis craccivora]|uniref:Uncharacterized protein n=1 Tax=Aphis craccivora TaxID=307492 RepID=A0A6G0WNZ9_APHCR|nr:Uncharacterized protein FWK35_00020745 [Aphis craccivora]
MRDYGPASHRLNLLSLADRHSARDSLFHLNLICGKTDSPSLLQHIHFRVPTRRTRNVAPFTIPTLSTEYFANKPPRVFFCNFCVILYHFIILQSSLK